MAELFDAIVEGGYYVPFAGFSAEQQECRAFTLRNLEELMCARQRERYVSEVKVCVCGFGPADEEEPMDEANFSQYQFFEPYINDLVFFVDKFDFVVKCVAAGVCKVAAGFEDRYTRVLLEALTFKHVVIPASPERVFDHAGEDTPRIVPELDRTEEEQHQSVERYVNLDRTYGDKLRAKLAALEKEAARPNPLPKEPVEWGGGEGPSEPTEEEADEEAAQEEGGEETVEEGGEENDAASAEPEVAAESEVAAATPRDGNQDPEGEEESPSEEPPRAPADNGDA